MLDANGVDASPASAGGGELLPEDCPEEGEGKRKGVVLLFPLSGIGAEIITLEVVGFRLLSNEGDVHDKSLTMLISVTVA